MFGFFNINKPVGPTSHDIVAAVRRLVGRDVKVGHAGTLDPFAEGVLVLCAGSATRLAELVQGQTKKYTASITLGATSSTDDSEGEITACTADGKAPSREAVEKILGGFVGEIRQIPPAHSAVHIAGRRAYALARAGEDFELPPRTITIHQLSLVRYDWPGLEIDVTCGSGVYIRALARDVGATLGVGGYCSRLIRTAVGPFHLQQAVHPDRLDPDRNLLPPTAALGKMPRIEISRADVNEISLGRAIPLPDEGRCRELQEAPRVALVGPGGNLIALAAVGGDGAKLQPRKVFTQA